jgi:2-desacetyl-2-hydroxyethyl bacteriochlorophyllide A dehydrogenase
MIAKRAVITNIRKLDWESFNLPDKPNQHEVFLKALYSLISPGTELAIFTGKHRGFSLPNPPFPLLPSYPGYALVGEVIAVGSKVKDIALGAKVLAEIPHGTHAIVNTQKNPVMVLPSSIREETAPLMRMAKVAITALRLAPSSLGDCVGIFGLGLVGLFACQLYHLAGARPVIGMDLIGKRRKLAQESGIVTLDPAEKNFEKQFKSIMKGREADILVEATGNPRVIPEALELVGRRGRVVLLGSPRGSVEIDPYMHIHRKGVTMIGAHESLQEGEGVSYYGRWNRIRNQELLMDLFASQEICTDGYITHVIKPQEIPSAYKLMEEEPETTLGVLIDWRGNMP